MAPRWTYWLVFALMLFAAVQHLLSGTTAGVHWGTQWIAIAWLLYRTKLKPWGAQAATQEKQG